MVDSTAVVSTGNAIVQVINTVWPIVASIVTYIIGHWHTSKPKKVTLPPK
jgi:hypothetical protein